MIREAIRYVVESAINPNLNNVNLFCCIGELFYGIPGVEYL